MQTALTILLFTGTETTEGKHLWCALFNAHVQLLLNVPPHLLSGSMPCPLLATEVTPQMWLV